MGNIPIRDVPRYRHFREDPLNLTIPVPERLLFDDFLADCTCRVPEECFHADWCGAFGIGAIVADDLCIYPHGLNAIWVEVAWTQSLAWKWVCSDGESWHTGGTINGPVHWCERDKMVIDPDGDYA